MSVRTIRRKGTPTTVQRDTRFILSFILGTVLLFTLPSFKSISEKMDTTEAKYRQAELIKECRLGLHVPGTKKKMDELFRISTSLHDRSHQTLALQYILLHYLHFNENLDTIREFTDSLKSFSLHTGSKYSYYFSWSQYIQYLIEGDTTLHTGKLELENMIQEVLDDNHTFGQIQCYRRFMAYYERLHLWDAAIEQSSDAIEITEKSDPQNRNLSMYYLDHAKLLRMVGKYTDSYDYVQKALNSYYEKLHKIQIIAFKCQLDAETDNYNSIINSYNDIVSDEELIREGQNTIHLYKIRFFYNLAKKDYAKALAAIREYENKANDPLQVSRLKLFLSSAMSQSALEKQDKPLQLDVNKSMLEFIWAVDSLNYRISRVMGDETLRTIDSSALMRKRGQEMMEAGARRRIIGNTLLSICVILIIVLVVLIIRNNKHNRKLREQTSAVAKKNIKLQQLNSELQETINNIKKNTDNAISRIDDITKDSKMKSSFIINLARELRNVALNGLDKASVCQLLEYAKNMEILQNLATRDHITIETINLNKICKEVFDKYIEENYNDGGVKFYFEPIPEEKPMIQANQEMLTLIICNLLRLSQNHTKEGEIILKTRRNQVGHLQLIVTDTGNGIPKSKRERMFERLPDFSDSDTGTILHLTICRIAAHSQNCRIWLDTAQYSISGTSIVVEF